MKNKITYINIQFTKTGHPYIQVWRSSQKKTTVSVYTIRKNNKAKKGRYKFISHSSYIRLMRLMNFLNLESQCIQIEINAWEMGGWNDKGLSTMITFNIISNRLRID